MVCGCYPFDNIATRSGSLSRPQKQALRNRGRLLHMDLRRQKRFVSVCLANGASYSPHFPRALNVALWGLDGHRAQVIDARVQRCNDAPGNCLARSLKKNAIEFRRRSKNGGHIPNPVSLLDSSERLIERTKKRSVLAFGTAARRDTFE